MAEDKRVVSYLRLSVTDRCNLRCVYCMPESGIRIIPHREILTFDEIEGILDAVAGCNLCENGDQRRQLTRVQVQGGRRPEE